MVERKIEKNQGKMKAEVMRDGMKKGVFRQGNSQNERLDFGKHAGKTFREVYLEDQGYSGWTVRQEKPGAKKLGQFSSTFLEDLTKKNGGIRGKADEVERQLRDRVLEVCCEEQMGKMSRQETRAIEEHESARRERRGTSQG